MIWIFIYQPKATGLAASLMPVASNVGIAFGSALGGIVYHQGNLMNVTLVGGLVAIFASLLTFLSHIHTSIPLAKSNRKLQVKLAQ